MQTTTNDVLIWITSAAGATALSSYLLTFWGKFTDLPQQTQSRISTALMVAIALAARFGIDYIPEDTKALITPYVVIAGGLLGGVFIQHQARMKGNDTNVRNIRSRAIKRGEPFERPTKF